MLFFNFLLSFFVSIVPPSEFTCGGSELNVTVYNGLHGQIEIVNDIESLDEDSFVILEWRDYEIKIPIINYGSTNFANRFWKWSYENEKGLNLKQPKLSRQYPTGRVVTYRCQA